MNLYEAPPKTWVKVEQNKEVLFFDHLDGMYSYCKDKNGNVVHLAAWTEVEIVDTP